MSDLIYRQDVLDILKTLRNRNISVYEYDKWIFGIPSAEPERKTEKWIDIDSETYTWKIRCLECGHERSMMSTQGAYPNYCENCGVKMKGKQQ